MPLLLGFYVFEDLNTCLSNGQACVNEGGGLPTEPGFSPEFPPPFNPLPSLHPLPLAGGTVASRGGRAVCELQSYCLVTGECYEVALGVFVAGRWPPFACFRKAPDYSVILVLIKKEQPTGLGSSHGSSSEDGGKANDGHCPCCEGTG